MKKSEENKKGADDNSEREFHSTATMGIVRLPRVPAKPPKSKSTGRQPK